MGFLPCFIKDKLRRLLIRMGGFGNKVNISESTVMHLRNARLKNCRIEVFGKNVVLDLGHDNIMLNCEIRVFGDDCKLTLGSKNRIEDARFWMEDERSRIRIGNYNRFTGSIELASIEGTSIIIGDDNLFSRDVQVSTGDSHSIINLDDGKRINPSKDIIIDNHIWIGMHATICKGVHILDNVIVGRGSILTRSIKEKNVAVAGVPASIIRKNIRWEFERI